MRTTTCSMTFKRNFRCPVVSLADSNIRIFEKCRHWKRWSYRQRDGDTLLVEGVHFSFGAFPCRVWLYDAICTIQRHVWTGVVLKRHSIHIHTRRTRRTIHHPSLSLTLHKIVCRAINAIVVDSAGKVVAAKPHLYCNDSCYIYVYREIVTRSSRIRSKGCAMKILKFYKKREFNERYGSYHGELWNLI